MSLIDTISKIVDHQKQKYGYNYERNCNIASEIVQAAVDEIGEEAFLQWIYDNVGDTTGQDFDTRNYYVAFYVDQLIDFLLVAHDDPLHNSIKLHCLRTLGLDPAYVELDTDIAVIAEETMNALVYTIVEESNLLSSLEETASITGWTHQAAYETLCSIANEANEGISSSLLSYREQAIASRALYAFREFIDNYENSVYLLRLLSDYLQWNEGYAKDAQTGVAGDYIMYFTDQYGHEKLPISEVFNVYGADEEEVQSVIKQVGELISSISRQYDYDWDDVPYGYWCEMKHNA